jgi:hypothetical protein
MTKGTKPPNKSKAPATTASKGTSAAPVEAKSSAPLLPKVQLLYVHQEEM